MTEEQQLRQIVKQEMGSLEASERTLGLHPNSWKAATAISTILGAVGVLFGIGWAVIEYGGTKRNNAVGATLALIERWDTSRVNEAWRCLERQLAIEFEVQSSELEIAKNLTSLDREAAFRQLYANASNNILLNNEACGPNELGRDSREAFDVVYEHFNELAICVSAEICHSQTAQIYYGDAFDDFQTVLAAPLAAKLNGRRQARQSFQALAKELSLAN